MKPTLTVALLLGLAGCGVPAEEESNYRQAEVLTLQQVEALRGHLALQLDLQARHLTLGYSTSSGCVTLEPDARATVNGEPLELLTRGDGYVSEEPPVENCRPPAWAYPGREVGEGTTTFELKDGTATLSSSYPGLGAPRTLSSDGDAGIPGRPFHVTWSPASDVLGTPTSSLEALDGGFPFAEQPLLAGDNPGEYSFVFGSAPAGRWRLRVTGTLHPAAADCSPYWLTCTAKTPFGAGQSVDPQLEVDVASP